MICRPRRAALTDFCAASPGIRCRNVPRPRLPALPQERRRPPKAASACGTCSAFVTPSIGRCRPPSGKPSGNARPPPNPRPSKAGWSASAGRRRTSSACWESRAPPLPNCPTAPEGLTSGWCTSPRRRICAATCKPWPTCSACGSRQPPGGAIRPPWKRPSSTARRPTAIACGTALSRPPSRRGLPARRSLCCAPWHTSSCGSALPPAPSGCAPG